MFEAGEGHLSESAMHICSLPWLLCKEWRCCKIEGGMPSNAGSGTKIEMRSQAPTSSHRGINNAAKR